MISKRNTASHLTGVDGRERGGSSPWRNFWDQGGWWKAVILAAVYYGLYRLGGIANTAFAGPLTSQDDPYANGVSAFVSLGAPILIGCLVLLGFAVSVGWTRELFRTQTVRGSWWMWAAVIIVGGFNVLRFLSVDYAYWDLGALFAILLTGVLIGFSEELLTRGFAIMLLRRAGYGERSVMLLSSLLFAALHAGNIFSGQAPLAVAITVIYTFAFGIAMYLALRITGNLIWPILLHASTDSSLILLTGGIDATPATLHPGPLADIANLANFAVIAFAIIGLIFIRNTGTKAARPGARPTFL